MEDAAPPPVQSTKSEVIATSAAAIDNSRWSNRLGYMWSTTGVLLVIMGGAVWRENDHAVTTLGGLIVANAILAVVTPSAEQISKMLAQVAAIRFGVGKQDTAP